jgi:hypothetical protein
MMRDLHERYPLYGFDRHKGYVTDDHVRALAEHGPSPVHRYSFVNVTRVAGPASPEASPADPVAPPELTGAAELIGLAEPAFAGPAGDLVTTGIVPAGAPGDNERRMDP